MNITRNELKQYMGTNPKPTDFDLYWDKAIDEMKKINPNIELTKSEFSSRNSECYDMYFTSVNNARIHVQYLKPANLVNKIPAVLLFHGYGGNSCQWSDKLKYLSAGLAVFAMDVRGQFGLSEDVGCVHGNTFNGHITRGLLDDDPNKLLFRDIFLDTAKLAEIVINMDCIDNNRVYAHGSSQGGALTIACAALEPRISKIAPYHPFLSDYRKTYDMGVDTYIGAEIRKFFRNYDPTHSNEEEIFNKLGYIDVHNLASRVKAKTLMCTGLLDRICPPLTQFAVFNNLKCEKEYLLFEDFGHEDIPMAVDKAFMFIINDYKNRLY